MSAVSVEQEDKTPPPAAAREQSPWRRFAAEFFSSKIAVAGLATLVIIILIAIFAPWLAPQNPTTWPRWTCLTRAWRRASRPATA